MHAFASSQCWFMAEVRRFCTTGGHVGCRPAAGAAVASGRNMRKDVVQVLLEDHAVLGWLAERLRPVSSTSAGTPMFNEFARALGAHQTVIDQTVIPALKACGWRGLSSDVLTGHMA